MRTGDQINSLAEALANDSGYTHEQIEHDLQIPRVGPRNLSRGAGGQMIRLKGELTEVGERDDGSTFFTVDCTVDDARAAAQFLFRGELEVTLAKSEAIETQAIVDDVRLFIANLGSHTIVISGGARGVDSLAEEEAKKRWLKVVVYMPDYEKHGKKAPLVRNQEIVDDCDELHAWPSSWSRGTWHTILRAKTAGVAVTVHEPFKRQK